MADFLIKKNVLSGIALIRKGEGIPDFESLLPDLGRLLESSKITKDEIYVKAGVFDLSGSKYFIKRYSPRNTLYRIGYLFKQTRAEHSWFASLLLEKHSIANPKVCMVYSKKKFGFIGNIYLITEAVNDVFSMEYFRKAFAAPDKRDSFCAKVIEQLAQVHNAGIFHSDAKLWNFYAYNDILGHEKIGIWDLDGAIIYKELPAKKRILDLSRTIASIIELNKETGFDVYSSAFIAKIASYYEKFSDCRLEIEPIENEIERFLIKKKIYKT